MNLFKITELKCSFIVAVVGPQKDILKKHFLLNFQRNKNVFQLQEKVEARHFGNPLGKGNLQVNVVSFPGFIYLIFSFSPLESLVRCNHHRKKEQ